MAGNAKRQDSESNREWRGIRGLSSAGESPAPQSHAAPMPADVSGGGRDPFLPPAPYAVKLRKSSPFPSVQSEELKPSTHPDLQLYPRPNLSLVLQRRIIRKRKQNIANSEGLRWGEGHFSESDLLLRNQKTFLENSAVSWEGCKKSGLGERAAESHSER